MDTIWAEGNGFRALVESYAVEPAPPHQPAYHVQALGCLALVGGRDAVRAILAHGINRGLIDLVTPGRAIRTWLGPEPAGWSLRLAPLAGERPAADRRRRLATRTTHGLLLPKSALRLDDPLAPDRFTLVVPPVEEDWPTWDGDTPIEPPPDGEQVYAAFGHQLRARLTTSFHPAWTAWLWRRLAEEGLIQRLVGRGPQVFRCRLPAERLGELIAAGCASGALPALITTPEQ